MWCENDMFCIEHIYSSFLNGLSVIHILVGPSVIGHPACTFHVEVASSICVFFILHVLGQKRSTLQFPRNITKLAFAKAKIVNFVFD